MITELSRVQFDLRSSAQLNKPTVQVHFEITSIILEKIAQKENQLPSNCIHISFLFVVFVIVYSLHLTEHIHFEIAKF